MFPFDPPENIRKPKVFWCFQGDQKGILGSKGLKKNLFWQNTEKNFAGCGIAPHTLHSTKTKNQTEKKKRNESES